MRMRWLLFFLIPMFPNSAWARQGPSELRALATTFEAELDRRKTARYEALLRSENPGARILNLAPEIQLMYMRDTGMPVYFATMTLAAAQTISTDDVWPGGITGYDLDGSGTTNQMAMWDGGDVFSGHETLAGRIFDQDGPGGDCLHPTWVAGVMIAAGGFNPLVKGMSHAANLLTYDATNDDVEMALAAANGLRISNHSYEIPGGWRLLQNGWFWFGDLDVDPSEDYGFGFYGAKAQAWDQIVYNAPHYFVQKGCGNDRGNTPPSMSEPHFHFDNQLGDFVFAADAHGFDGGTIGYDSISWFGNAKNIVTVGSVLDIPAGYGQPSDVVASSFTSFGPCDDGRIKPDLVANGDLVWMPDCSGPSAYFQTSGTSLAGPCVAGSANLLRELYESTHGAAPRAATLKAILIHTADEAGPADGPDYQFGWGLMNTRRGADVIATLPPRVEERVLAQGATQSYDIQLDSPRDLCVTIAWTDPPGAPPPPSVDPTDPALVNDLDLWMVHLPSQTRFEPWGLDGTNPAAAATRGDNLVDNVERVDIGNAPAGHYRIFVGHKGTLVPGQQAYSIVSSEGFDNLVVPVMPLWGLLLLGLALLATGGRFLRQRG